MSTKTTIILFILVYISLLFLSTGYAQQDYTRWGLPDGAIARLGKGAVNEIQYSPDGKFLAVATYAGIWLYDVGTTQELDLMDATNEVQTVAFSPDGMTLASGPNGDYAKLWDVNSRTFKTMLKSPGGRNPINSIVYSSDGKMLATVEFDRIFIWNTTTAEIKITLSEYDESHEHLHSSKKVRPNVVAFSPDGSTIASGCNDKTIRIWDVNSGTIKATLTGHKGQVTSVDFNLNGDMLASGSWDSTVMLWDVATQNLKATFKGHTGPSQSVTFSPDGNTIASGGSFDHTLQFWDVHKVHEEQNEPLNTFVGHTYPITSIAYSPNGEHLASASNDGTIRFWDIATGQHINTIRGHLSNIESVAFSPDSSTLVNTSGPDLYLWDVNTASYINSLVAHTRSVSSVVYSPDGMQLASGSRDNSILLWDIEKVQQERVLLGHTNWITAIAYSPDGQLLASGSYDKTVRLWDVDTGELKNTLDGHSDHVLAVSFMPDGRMLASGSKDKTIRLWHIPSGTHLTTLQSKSEVNWVVFNPNNETLASKGEGSTIELWDVHTFKQISTITGKDTFNDGVFSPNGKILVGTHWGKISLWDMTSLTNITTLHGHNQGVDTVTFSPNGNIVASGALDGVVYLWDLSAIIKAKE
ncbi:hypothetical protein C6497_10845 [Candidatus Poribacteria bacterium]|nr:MAG: hypothetical protein C6497_10845 [Candidatus Poribacteria bacterium]